MRFRIPVGMIATIIPIQLAYAQSFPSQDDICIKEIVSKSKLAQAFLQNEKTWNSLYLANVDTGAPATNAPFQYVWRRIYTDSNFCKNNPTCIAPDPDKTVGGKPVRDTVVAEKTLQDLRNSFDFALQEQTAAGKPYAMVDFGVGTDYFRGDDNVNKMTCVTGLPQVAKSSPSKISLPIRLRSSSDELTIDSNSSGFKNTKPAKIAYTDDYSAGKTQTVTLIGALGVPIPLSFPKPPSYLNYFTGELVPYVSANQTITKKGTTPSSYSATSYTATGMQFNSQTIFEAAPGVNHVLSAAPQYLWNAHDQSRIASVKAFYTPWTLAPAGAPSSTPEINTPFTPGGILGASTLSLTFDLRYNQGQYTDRGDDPKTVAQHTSFSRGGTKFGLVFSTPSDGPHLALTVSEAMLYGFSGQARHLDEFASELDYYFDSTSNLAFTVSYNDGRDEDTAEKVQLWTVGLAAKF